MKTVGLTGGIGSGKSTVARIFEAIEIPVFNSDLEARHLFTLDEVKSLIHKVFGPSVFTNDIFDRAKMASIVFNDPLALENLNAIIHPLVGQMFKTWTQQYIHKPYVIEESAILFEFNLHRAFDCNILVYAPEYIRIQRVIKRDSLSESQIRERINNQLPDNTKKQMANYVIDNYNGYMLIPQVLEIDKKMRNEE